MITTVTLKLTHIIHPETEEEYKEALQYLQTKDIFVYEHPDKNNVEHMCSKNYWKQYVEDMKKAMFIICFEYNGKLWCVAHPSRSEYKTAIEAAETFRKDQSYKFEVTSTCEIKEGNELYNNVTITILNPFGEVYKEIRFLKEFKEFFKTFKETDFSVVKNGETFDLDYSNGIDFYLDILEL